MKQNNDRIFVDFREIDFMVVSAVRSRRTSLREIVKFVGLDKTVAWPVDADRTQVVSGRLRSLKKEGRLVHDGRWGLT